MLTHRKFIRLMAILGLVGLLTHCQDSKPTSGGSAEESKAIPTGSLEISGTLANGEDTSNTEVLKEQTVSIVRSDGVTVGETTTDASGGYKMAVPAGGLVVGTAYDLTSGGATTETPTTDEFTYTLEAKVPDDGNGKALGLKQKVDLSSKSVSNGAIALGETKLKEISAIVGTVVFEETNISISGVDVFIPGKPYFVRTGDDGAFSLLFVPPGTYSIRLTKGVYFKDVTVTVTAGKTLAVGETSIAIDDRDPLPLSQAMVGTWNVTCYYKDAGSTTPENPKTGVVTFSSLTSVTVDSGDSCVMRTGGVATPPLTFASFTAVGDGALIGKFGAEYYYHYILGYSNNKITFSADERSISSTKVIEIWERK